MLYHSLPSSIIPPPHVLLAVGASSAEGRGGAMAKHRTQCAAAVH